MSNSMNFPILYKIGSKGETRAWEISVENNGPFSVIYTHHGVINGKMQTAKEEVHEGKNLGKANATDHNSQAIAQAQGTWNKKLDNYYAQSIADATKLKTKTTRPMKAFTLAEKEHTLTIGQSVFYQPKIDGMRVLASKEDGEVALLSRSGKLVTALPHLNEELKSLMNDGETWDGEAYSDGIDFEDLMSLCRPKKPKPNHKEVQYHVFDAVANTDFKTRFLTGVRDRFTNIAQASKYVNFVTTIETNYNYTEIQKTTDTMIKAGYEGLMLRVAAQPTYEHKKTKYLLKCKRFHDAEYKIIGFETGKRGTKTDGLLATFIMEYTNNLGELDEFDSVPLGTHKKLKEMWANRDSYIGQMATVKYQELTKYGAPRFGKVKGTRPVMDMDPE